MFDNFEFFMIKPIHYDEVIEHLRENFFYDEPLNRAVGLCREKGEGHPELEKHSLATLSDGVSVAVQNSKGEIVGVCLNGILHPGETSKAKEALDKCQDARFRKIFNLLYDQNLKFNLFEMFNIDRVFEYRILSVDKNYRGQGLAKKLVQRSEDVARKYHCKVVKGDATAAGSLAICLSLGLKPIQEISYKDIDIDVSPPHEKLVILYKNLDDKK